MRVAWFGGTGVRVSSSVLLPLQVCMTRAVNV
jgi:hypothetical protein